MSAQLSPVLNGNQFDGNGDLLVNGRIWWYQAGTSTPQDTYTDHDGIARHTNPIVLNARGKAPFPIYLGTGMSYKAVLETAPSDPTNLTAHGSVLDTYDFVGGVNDVTLSVIDGGTYT